MIPDGVIAEAIYGGTMTTGQVRDRIAAAAGLHAETTAELIEGLSRPGAGALTVLIDALDEAADPPRPGQRAARPADPRAPWRPAAAAGYPAAPADRPAAGQAGHRPLPAGRPGLHGV